MLSRNTILPCSASPCPARVEKESAIKVKFPLDVPKRPSNGHRHLHTGSEFHQLHTPGTAHVRTHALLRPTLLTAALYFVGLHAPPLLALGLGPITTHSAIGEPLRAEIALIGNGEPTPASTCFSLDMPATAGADDLPWLGSGRIRTQGRTVSITSTAPVNEPILMVGVRIGCGYEVIREYTVLLQPQVEGRVGPAVAGSAAGVDTLSVPASPAASQLPMGEKSRLRDAAVKTEPAQPRPVRKPRHARTPGTPEGDRLRIAPVMHPGAGLKMSGGLASRPNATEAQREALRTEQKLLAALDEQIATHLAIEDKVRQLEARLAALQKQLADGSAAIDAAPVTAATGPGAVVADARAPDATAATPPVPADAGLAPAPVTAVAPAEPISSAPSAHGLSNRPTKVITKLPPDSQRIAEPVLAPDVNWIVAGLGAFAAGAVLGGGWLWRRRTARLAEASAQRQREMESRLAVRNSSLRREERAADIEFSQGSLAPSEGQASGTRESVRREPVQSDGAGAGAAEADIAPFFPGAEVSSIGYFPGEAPAEHVEDISLAPQAAPAESAPDTTSGVDFDLGQDSNSGEPAHSRLDLEFDTAAFAITAVATKEAPAPSGPRLIASNAGVTIDQSAPPANEEAPPSHEHVLELAEIMMSFGRAEGAAQTLSEFLRDYPKESLVPWLKLLDLYHKGGRRGEYDDLAPKLNRAFNVKVPEWEDFTGPTTSESVEQFTHIMARVNASWPNQDCLDYLTELLRDNRAGTRVGFPLGVIDDILLLKSVLEWLIANPSMTSTGISRLALL